jgi:hypothetical protein
MTLAEAQLKAQEFANETDNSVLVYQSTHRAYREEIDQEQEYGIALTLPTFAVRIGERIYPYHKESV